MKGMRQPVPSESAFTVLVTGASGFVGLNVVEQLLSQAHAVIAVSHDEFPPVALGEFLPLDGRLTTTVADVRDTGAMKRLVASADVVIHSAAITVSDDHEHASDNRILEVNIGGTRSVLEATRTCDRPIRIVYVSSGAVYGEATFGSEEITEHTAAQPASLYGLTKLTSEVLVRQHAVLSGTTTVNARLSAVFGPWERNTGVRETLSPMYQLAAAAQQGEAMPMLEFAPRNWLYARDAALAITHLAVGPVPSHNLYNVTPTLWSDPDEWADQLYGRYPDLDPTPSDGSTLHYDSEPGRLRAPVSNSRLRSELPDWPRFSPAEAFADYLTWLERHPEYL